MNNINDIKKFAYSLGMQAKNENNPANQHAKNIVRELNQTDRKILKKILDSKKPSDSEVIALGKHLEEFQKKKPQDFVKKHKPITHALKNLCWKRVSSKTLLSKARKISLPSHEILTDKNLRATPPASPSHTSSSKENLKNSKEELPISSSDTSSSKDSSTLKPIENLKNNKEELPISSSDTSSSKDPSKSSSTSTSKSIDQGEKVQVPGTAVSIPKKLDAPHPGIETNFFEEVSQDLLYYVIKFIIKDNLSKLILVSKKFNQASRNLTEVSSTLLKKITTSLNKKDLSTLLDSYPNLINAKGDNGETLLHHAVFNAVCGIDREWYSILFNVPGINFGIADDSKNTPLHIAAIESSNRDIRDYVFPEFCRQAAKQGFNFLAQGQKGQTLLHYAARIKCYGLNPVKFIIEHLKVKGIPNLDTLSSSGSTALFYAINSMHLDYANILLDAGASPKVFSDITRSPLSEVEKKIAQYEQAVQLNRNPDNPIPKSYLDELKLLKTRIQTLIS